MQKKIFKNLLNFFNFRIKYSNKKIFNLIVLKKIKQLLFKIPRSKNFRQILLLKKKKIFKKINLKVFDKNIKIPIFLKNLNMSIYSGRHFTSLNYKIFFLYKIPVGSFIFTKKPFYYFLKSKNKK